MADERQEVDRLALMGERAAQVLEEWNATEADYPRETCVHELFEAQVARTPGRGGGGLRRLTLTYAELNARANRLAQHLRALGVGPGMRVAICSSARSIWWWRSWRPQGRRRVRAARPGLPR